MINISNILDLTNYAFVLFFGITAAFYFVGIHFEDNKKQYIFTILVFGCIQLIAYLLLGKQTLYTCYPLLIHLPLILLIFFVFHQSISMSIISVLTAYLLCTPRKWIGTLVSSFFGYNQDIANAAAILVTIPLLILIIKYLSPYVEKLKYESTTSLLPFLLLPLAYYIIEYAFTVYTDLLHTGGIIYHTSRVVAILEESEDCVRFETQNSHYHLSMSPFPLAAVSPFPMRLAACA